MRSSLTSVSTDYFGNRSSLVSASTVALQPTVVTTLPQSVTHKTVIGIDTMILMLEALPVMLP
jgi:hypothetical protein